MRAGRRLWRLVVYGWVAPTSAPGLVIAGLALLTGGRARAHTGVLEVHGGAAAMTLGHVVLGVSVAALAATRAHERVHVRQAERWGPLFLPAYGVASLAAWWRGGSAYRDNRFESEAYRDAPDRPRQAPPS